MRPTGSSEMDEQSESKMQVHANLRGFRRIYTRNSEPVLETVSVWLPLPFVENSENLDASPEDNQVGYVIELMGSHVDNLIVLLGKLKSAEAIKHDLGTGPSPEDYFRELVDDTLAR